MSTDVVVTKVLHYNLEVSEFKLQSLFFFVHFPTKSLLNGMDFLIPPDMD